MKTLIIGAASTLGREVARSLAKRQHHLFLVGSDARDLEALARDLSVRFNAKVQYIMMDMIALDTKKLMKEVHNKFGRIDNLLCLTGFHHEDENQFMDEKELTRLTLVNFEAPVKIINRFIEDLTSSTQGNCVGLGSIFAQRGRRTSIIYGSCKHGLEYYFEALRHRFANTRCRVQFYRLGWVETQDSRDNRFFKPASVVMVAESIANGLGKDRLNSYLPGWWQFVVFFYKLLPWFIFKRLTKF